MPPPRWVLEGRGAQAANDGLPGSVVEAEDLLAEAPRPPPLPTAVEETGSEPRLEASPSLVDVEDWPSETQLPDVEVDLDGLDESPTASSPPPPASQIRLSDPHLDQAPLARPEACSGQDGGAPPSAALSLVDELLAEGPPVAQLADDALAEDLSVLEDELPQPTDSVAAMLVDAIAAYEEEHGVAIDYLDQTGRYEELACQWLEGLDLGAGSPEAVGRLTIIPEPTDEETQRMERHR